jgi:acyl carrier protein
MAAPFVQPVAPAIAIRNAIAEVVGNDPAEITEETNLSADYGLDSLELMAIGTRLERTLGITLEPEDLLKAENVGHAIRLLSERLRFADETGQQQ